MSTMVQVRALQRDGYDGAWRAGRKWPDSPVLVEVLDQDEDPEPIEQTITGPDGKPATRKVPDPQRIGRNTFAQLKADHRIKILSDKETTDEGANTALLEARKIAEDAHRDLIGLRIENATLKKENEQLRQQLADSQDALAVIGPENESGEGVPGDASEESSDHEGDTTEGETTETTEGKASGGSRRRGKR